MTEEPWVYTKQIIPATSTNLDNPSSGLIFVLDLMLEIPRSLARFRPSGSQSMRLDLKLGVGGKILQIERSLVQLHTSRELEIFVLVHIVRYRQSKCLYQCPRLGASRDRPDWHHHFSQLFQLYCRSQCLIQSRLKHNFGRNQALDLKNTLRWRIMMQGTNSPAAVQYGNYAGKDIMLYFPGFLFILLDYLCSVIVIRDCSWKGSYVEWSVRVKIDKWDLEGELSFCH